LFPNPGRLPIQRNLRKLLSQGAVLQVLVFDAAARERFASSDQIWIGRAGRYKYAGLMKEKGTEVRPQFERPQGTARVDFIRSIRHPNDAGFSAGARSRISGSMLVDQQHARAAPLQVIRGPGAKDARTHYDDIML
jgi:hypothetical protein